MSPPPDPIRLVILMNPRSGSTSLGKTLCQRDDFHCWDEVFNLGGWAKRGFAALGVASCKDHPGPVRDYLDYLTEATAVATGKPHLGIEVKPFDQVLCHALLGTGPWERFLNYLAVLDWATHVVILYRESLFDQALSLHIAWHDGGWGRATPFEPFEADLAAFLATQRRLYAAECFCRSSARLACRPSFDLSYEKLVRLGTAPLEEWLGLPAPQGPQALAGQRINPPARQQKVLNLDELRIHSPDSAERRSLSMSLEESFRLLSS